MKTDAQFKLEKEVLDGALIRDGASVEFPTPGKAIAFRHRCYTFRKWKRETMGDLSPYENLTIKALAPGERTVQIVPRELDAIVTFVNTEPMVEMEPIAEVEIDEDLLDEAEDLVRKLNL